TDDCPGRSCETAVAHRRVPRCGPPGDRAGRPMNREMGCVVGPLALLLALGSAAGVHAYLKIGTNTSSGTLVDLKWKTFPIRYFVTNRDVPGVTAPQLQTAIHRAMATWDAVPHVSLSSQFVGFTSTEPG